MPAKKTTVSKSSKAVKGKTITKVKPLKKAAPAKAVKAKPKQIAKLNKVVQKTKPAKPAKVVNKGVKAANKPTTAKTVKAKVPQKASVKSTAKKKPTRSARTMTTKTSVKTPGNVSGKSALKATAKPLATTRVAEIKVSQPKTSQAKTAVGKGTLSPYQERPGEDYMNAAQREHFRSILLHWKNQLMEEVDRTVHHMQDEAANFPDPNDRATQEEEFSLELRTRDRERKLIKKIEEALQQIENNDYGYCDACGIEIGIRRLEARPTATLCIDCKTIDEIKERQMGGSFS